jgi:hypothetical protein
MKKVRYVMVTGTKLFRIETDTDKEAQEKVLDGEGTAVTEWTPGRADVLNDPPGCRINTTQLSNDPMALKPNGKPWEQ